VASQVTRAHSAEQAPREVKAQAKWVRSPARKARLVTDQIRGRSVPEARTILAFSQRAIAREIEKVLNSAVANVESRPELADLRPDEMVISAAYADEGPTMKRWRARARGRVARIRKRTCHITVRLREVPAPPSPPPAPKEETTAAAPKPRARKTTTATRKKTTTTRKKTTGARK
jgi:large subunit ribosomal protein L22